MTAALTLAGVHKQFGETKIIRGVSLEIAKGERHAIIGPNGAGKTTLFNLISGRFPITSGSISLNGERIDTLDGQIVELLVFQAVFQDASANSTTSALRIKQWK